MAVNQISTRTLLAGGAVAGFQWLVATALIELRRLRLEPAVAPAYA